MPGAQRLGMKKRILAAILWFCTGWYAWAFVASLLALDPSAGVVIGAFLAALIGGDPAGVIWTPRPRRPRASRRLVGAR